MDGRILALLLVVVAGVSLTDEDRRRQLEGQFARVQSAWESARRSDQPVVGARSLHESKPPTIEPGEIVSARFVLTRSERSARPARHGSARRMELHTRTFPVADLLPRRGGGEPTFDDSHDLISLLKRATGRRHWRRGEIDWHDRRKMIRVEQTPELLDEVGQTLRRFRTFDNAELQFTLRVIVLPEGTPAGPADGRCAVVVADRLDLLRSAWEENSIESRRLESRHQILSGDVIYAWTSANLRDESCYRGLTVLCRAAETTGDVSLVAIPCSDDEERMTWPRLTLSTGETAVYDLPAPPSDARTDDRTKSLVLLTLDQVTAAGAH